MSYNGERFASAIPLRCASRDMVGRERVSIRSAVVADAGAITAIYAPVVLDSIASFELVPPDDAEMARTSPATAPDAVSAGL